MSSHLTALTIGDTRITLLRAGAYWWDGGAMFGVVPRSLWGRTHQPDEQNRIECGLNCCVVETADHRILIDTGGGVRFDERARERQKMPQPPQLREVLAAAGFEPETFDTVINTHLHWDHCGGNTVDENGRAVASLPHARYFVQRGELLHAREQHPRDAVSYRAINYEPLLEAGQLHLIEGDREIVPGVAVRVAPGHNRDMMVVLVRSGHDTWCHAADLAPFAAQITPTWVAGFDLYPMETIAQKQELFSRAAAEGWWLSFAHEPRLAFAKIETREGKWRTTETRA